MLLKNIDGDILYSGYFYSMKELLQEAIAEKIDLKNANLRYADLSGLNLKSIDLQGVSLWSANLSGADLSYAILTHANCRLAIFKDASLVHSHCAHANFHGAVLNNTDLTRSDLTATKFSRGDIFLNNWDQASNIQDAIYTHKGEYDFDLSSLRAFDYLKNISFSTSTKTYPQNNEFVHDLVTLVQIQNSFPV